MWNENMNQRWGWTTRTVRTAGASPLGWALKTAFFMAGIVVLPLIMATIIIALAVGVTMFVVLALTVTVVTTVASIFGMNRTASPDFAPPKDDGRQNVRVIVPDNRIES